MKDRNQIFLLLINLGLFTVIGSLISRLHVLQGWMALNYKDFSLVLFSFSLGAVISNLIVGRLVQMKGPKKVLTVTMCCIVLSMMGFWEKPNYLSLIGFWVLLSFGFSGSMVVLMTHAGIFQAHHGKNWMSFFQGVSGIGAITGMFFGLLANFLDYPIDAHFPVVGMFSLILMALIIFWYSPFEQEKEKEAKKIRPSLSLIILGCINFCLILSVSQIISWSGMTLRDQFHFKNDMATLGSLGFIVAETIVRFWGDSLTQNIGKIHIIVAGGLLTCISILFVYLFQTPSWALIGFVSAGFFSGIIQPVVFGLCSEQPGNMAKNFSFVLLFQSLAFLVGPLASGTIAKHLGLFEIYLFSSGVSFMIVLFGFSYYFPFRIFDPKPKSEQA